MKSKAPLVMMEQMVMILVFALAAALCLRAFVLSDSMSKESERRDRAVLLCENLAEDVKNSAGSMQKEYAALAADGASQSDPILYYYDGKGRRTEGPAVYRLEVEPVEVEEGLAPYLGKAVVRALDEESGKELFNLEFAWQR